MCAWWRRAAAAGQEPGSQQVLVGQERADDCSCTPVSLWPRSSQRASPFWQARAWSSAAWCRIKKKFVTPAEVLFSSFSFHFPRCKLSHKCNRGRVIWHLCQMDSLAIGDPGVSPGGDRSGCDIWSLQLQGQGMGKAVQPAAGGAPSLWHHCNPVPHGNVCAQPLPQEHPFAAQLREALWYVNIFLSGFSGKNGQAWKLSTTS